MSYEEYYLLHKEIFQNLERIENRKGVKLKIGGSDKSRIRKDIQDTIASIKSKLLLTISHKNTPIDIKTDEAKNELEKLKKINSKLESMIRRFSS